MFIARAADVLHSGRSAHVYRSLACRSQNDCDGALHCTPKGVRVSVGAAANIGD